MRLIIAILVFFCFGFVDLKGENTAKFHTLYWKDGSGHVVYEGHYQVTYENGIPVLTLVKSFRHGPFRYRCLGPERIPHGNGIFIRHYLPRPMICQVPAGFKVCLEPALVDHGPVKVLPYLYLGSGQACRTAHPCLAEPLFYRPARLIPAGFRG